jgi:hypothetical protein
MDADAWTAIIPSMGYMARLRNLRNFDEAGVSATTAAQVAAFLANPDEVARSRQFPYRFWTAYREVHSDRWAMALGAALDRAAYNIPALPGRTLVLCDMSGSMGGMLSDKSKMTRAEAAALFAVALSYRCSPRNIDLVGYATGSFRHDLAMGGSVLRQVERFVNRIGEAGHATYTAAAMATNYAGQDRVVIFTDEQCHDNPASVLPAEVPCYTFNLAGYRVGHLPSGSSRRHTLGGLSDATFKLIPLIEAGASADWGDILGDYLPVSPGAVVA